MDTCDILIVGGGLAGLATALALGDLGLGVRVFDQDSQAHALDDAYDGRASAISEASVRLLRALGAWEGMASAAEPIRDIVVADGFSSAFVHFDHGKLDQGNTPFGHIIPNTAIRSALMRRCLEHPHITLHHEARIARYDHFDHGCSLTLNSGELFSGRLLVACDGRFSKTREWMGITHRTTMYGQTAVVCTVRHELPHQGVALERFLSGGPFAALPMTDQRCCIVWTEADDMAKHLLKLDEPSFNESLNERAGAYLGKIWLEGERFSYPLSLVQSSGYVATRSVLVGDAAHGIHPIAGQGINLGYRDVAALRDVLRDALHTGADIGDAITLERYQRWRAFDATSMGMVMDGLVRLFSTNLPPVRHLRRLGLRAVEQLPPAKRFFMLHAMGLLGDLPEFLEDIVVPSKNSTASESGMFSRTAAQCT